MFGLKKYCILGLKNGAGDFLYFEDKKTDALALVAAALSVKYYYNTAFAVGVLDEKNGLYKIFKTFNDRSEKIKFEYKIDCLGENTYKIYLD